MTEHGKAMRQVYVAMLLSRDQIYVRDCLVRHVSYLKIIIRHSPLADTIKRIADTLLNLLKLIE